MTRRCPPEADLQRAVLRHLEIRAAPHVYWFHVGNGGWRSPIEAKVFKGLGVRAGVPDLILIHEGRTYGLELKADAGRLAPVQATAHVAVLQLERWGLLRGRASLSIGRPA